jgi:hypothetical protein
MPGPPTDQGYTLLPADPGVMSPDLALEAALAPVIEIAPPTPMPLGKGWAFDFENQAFIRAGSSPAEVFDTDNLRIWIEKTLRTARFAHPVYTDVYGIEDKDEMIGQPFDGTLAAQYQNAVVDALMVHDRIAAVDNFYFQNDPMAEQVYVSFTVTLDQEADQTIQVSSIPLIT